MFSLIILISSISLLILDSSAQINPSRPAISKEIHVETSRTRNTRLDERKVRFEIDGQYQEFNFVQSDRNVYDRYSPVWLVKSAPGGNPNYTFEIVKNSDRFINGHIYVDNDKNAVVFVHYDQITKKILYDGRFGAGNETYVIKSLEHQSRLQRSLNLNKASQVITKVKENNIPMHLHSLAPSHLTSQSQEKNLETPLTIFYPKILAVVDNHLFRKLGSDIDATVRYMATFWNMVDQSYIELESPKVQFILTGIIVAEDETALNYVYQSRYTDKDAAEDAPDKANTDLMLEKARLYVHYNLSSDIKNFENYDAVVVLTGLDTYAVPGATHRAKICDNWYNTAIVTDNGEFWGVRTAVHEMAHLLNVDHDSLTKEGKCYALAIDGFISVMSPIQIDSRKPYWSDCSKGFLNDFSKLKTSQCLEKRQRAREYPED